MTATRRCAVIAHRGGAAEVPENTWSAVQHVADLGLEWMETDLRRSADGVVILSHDPDLGRTAGCARAIKDMTWDELKVVDAGDGIPRLRLNIDLKEAPAAQDTLQVVRAAQALERVRFASFSARRLAMVRRQEPRAVTSLGVADVAGLLVLAEAALPLPHSRWGWTRGQVDAVQVPTAYGRVPVLTRRMIAQAHRAGLEVHVWTVDDPEQMRRLAALNVDGIVTDVPSLALEVLGAAPSRARMVAH